MPNTIKIIQTLIELKLTGMTNKQLLENLMFINEREYGFNNALILMNILEPIIKESKSSDFNELMNLFTAELKRQVELKRKNRKLIQRSQKNEKPD